MEPTTALTSPPKHRQKSHSKINRAGSQDILKDDKTVRSVDFSTPAAGATPANVHSTMTFPKGPTKVGRETFDISPTTSEATPDLALSSPLSGPSTPASSRQPPKSPFTRIKALVFNRVPSEDTGGSSGMFGNRTSQRVGTTMTTVGGAPRLSIPECAGLGQFDLQVELYPFGDVNATGSESAVTPASEDDSFVTALETAASTGTFRSATGNSDNHVNRVVPGSDTRRIDDFPLLESPTGIERTGIETLGKIKGAEGGRDGQGGAAGHERSASVDASTNTPSEGSKRKASLPKITKAKSKARNQSIDKTFGNNCSGDGNSEPGRSPDSSTSDAPQCKPETPPTIAQRSLVKALEKRVSSDVITVQPLKTGPSRHFYNRIRQTTPAPSNPHLPLDFESALLALKRHGRQGIGGSVPLGLSTFAGNDNEPETNVTDGAFQRPRDDVDNVLVGTFLTIPGSQGSVLKIRPTTDKTVIASSLALGSTESQGIVRSSSDQTVSARYSTRSKNSSSAMNGNSSRQVDSKSLDRRTSSSGTTLSRPLKLNQNTLLVKVIFHLGNRRESVTLEVTPDTTPRQVVEMSCRRFDIMDDWSYAIFSEALNAWLPENVRLGSYPADRCNILFMKPKSPEYLEATSTPRTKSNSRAAATTRLSPYNSLTNLFCRPDHALKSKIHSNCVYLSTLLFTFDNRILMAGNGMLPTVIIGKGTAEGFESNSEEFNWLLKVSMDWERPIGEESENSTTASNSALESTEEELDYDNDERYDFNRVRARQSSVRYEKEESFRYAFYKAADQLRTVLNLGILGTVHDAPLETATLNSKIILAIQYIPEADRDDIGGELVRNGTLRWRSPDNLNPSVYNRSQPLWTNYARKFESRRVLLSPGLYLGMFHLESTLSGINVLVPEERNTFIPVEKIRDEHEVHPDEWNWLRAFSLRSSSSEADVLDEGDPQPETETESFKTLFVKSFQRIQQRTGLKVDHKDLYVEEVIQIDNMGAGTTFTSLKPGCDAFTSPSNDTTNQLSGRSSLPNLHLNAGNVDNSSGDGTRKSSETNPSPPPTDIARVIFVIRPMRCASHRRPSTLDTSRYVMYPFSIFEALCHHTFNSIVYDPFRRTMLSLQETLYLLRTELKVDLSKNGYPDINERTLDEKYRHAQQFGALGERSRRTKMAMSILEEEAANLNNSWLKMNWTVKLIKWDRKRSGMENRGSHYSFSIPSADTG